MKIKVCDEITIEDLRGTPRGSRPRSRILAHYETVMDARARGWSWVDIGDALGMSGDATRKSCNGVQRAVAAGRVDRDALSRAKTAPRKPQTPTQQTEQPDRAAGLKTWGAGR